MDSLRLSGGEDFISTIEIAERTQDLADYYTDLYGNEELVMLVVLKGAARFGLNLSGAINNPNIVEDFVRTKSMDGARQGEVRYLIEPEEHIKGRNVLVVEDVDDTRNTLSLLMPRLKDQAPKRLDLVSLLDKPFVDKVVDDLPCDDIKYGFRIADRFVVGHGLDWNGLYRAQTHISVAENIARNGQENFWVPLVAEEPQKQVIQQTASYPNPTVAIVGGLI